MNQKILNKLYRLAKKSLKKNEFPVSAIIYSGDQIISCGYNRRNKSKKTIDHAEIIAINKANHKLKTWKLSNTCMVVTLEPCDMCKTVIKEARINKVYYIVPRLKYKKQYKCTHFDKLNDDSIKKEQYLQDIKHFFDDKR